MTPAWWEQLQQTLVYVRGVGPRKAEVLAKHGLNTIFDLLEYFPRRYLDRTSVTRVSEIEAGKEITIVGRVLRARTLGYGRFKKRFEAVLHDGSGQISLVWFNRVNWVSHFLHEGEVIAASGKPSEYRGWQLQHPAVEKLSLEGEGELDENSFLDLPDDYEYSGQIVPIYPGTEELRKAWLDSRAFKRIVRNVYSRESIEPEEMLPAEIRARHQLVGFSTALHDVHLGESLEAVHHARRRLKFQELFMLQLMLAYRRAHIKQEEEGISFEQPSPLLDQLLAELPFTLTTAQRRVIDEILADMREPRPMNRLLQGDVGSGKTLVALAAMLVAVDNGYQAALMAPTEILAEQHFRSTTKMLGELGPRVTLLTGSRKGELRRKALAEIASGQAAIVLGTHALFQEAVEFANLGLVIIDEQHRFGVEQRATLRRKGKQLDTLVMTATPIPRTMAITAYGDMDLSLLDQMPPGRLPVTTAWRGESKRKEIFAFVRERVLQHDEQAYIVYPLVEESEKLDLRAAEEAFEELKGEWLADCRLGLLHGRMKATEKDAVMRDFLKGDVQVLVSTTVIEVGVDNPRATIMVVEQAERFGLSQLHQLRGRVGRGGGKSWCVLVAGKALSQEGHERLTTMAKTSNGFEISEVDMRMRGVGDFFGTRQSGLPELKIADIINDQDLLLLARHEAFELVARDHQLRLYPALRDYLHLRHHEQMLRIED